MKRTTILADDDLILEMRNLAARRGVTFTSLTQEAMRAYLAAQRPSTRRSFIGLGASGRASDAGDGRDEEELRQAVHPIYGLAPAPPGGWGE